jgi:hypothetical protein
MPVAESTRALCDRAGLIEGQDPEGRMHPRQQPVSGGHRAGEAGAPAPAGRRVRQVAAVGGRAHSAASRISASAGRALRRLCQRPRSRAASNRSRIARVAAGLAARRRSNTSASAIQAA